VSGWRRLLLLLVHAKCTFPDPAFLRAHDVEVQEVVQNAGECFYGPEGWFHWGVNAAEYTDSIACNLLSVWWLIHGLPLLIEFLAWLVGVLDARRPACKAMPALHKQVFQPFVLRECLNIVPHELTCTLLKEVKGDLGKFQRGETTEVAYPFALSEIPTILGDVKQAFGLLHKLRPYASKHNKEVEVCTCAVVDKGEAEGALEADGEAQEEKQA
jgi:hypothetical protein